MWFRNTQLLKLAKPMTYTSTVLTNKFESLTFSPCPTTLPSSAGWVAPSEDEYAPLVHAVNGYMLICLQSEDKILPATVVNQKLKEQIKEIETNQQRKVSTREKYTIKDSIYNTLLPKAFSKKSKIYAYFDTKNNWLILNTTNKLKTELFINSLKKSLPNVILVAPDLKKVSKIMAKWLLNGSQPQSMELEKSCVLQDPNHIGRVIRCQQQDLSAHTVQAFLKDGYEVNQLALSWQDQIQFVLKDDFSLCSIKYQDTALELAEENLDEDKQTKFNANFIIMTDILSKSLLHLTRVLFKNNSN